MILKIAETFGVQIYVFNVFLLTSLTVIKHEMFITLDLGVWETICENLVL